MRHRSFPSGKIWTGLVMAALGGGLLLTAVLIIGLITASDYGITTDEFIFDAYGPKALAWYSSWFTNRSLFEYGDTYLYGPWFQILVAVAQSTYSAKPFVLRHASSFVVGLSGIAALLPLGRLRWGHGQDLPRWSSA